MKYIIHTEEKPADEVEFVGVPICRGDIVVFQSYRHANPGCQPETRRAQVQKITHDMVRGITHLGCTTDVREGPEQ